MWALEALICPAWEPFSLIIFDIQKFFNTPSDLPPTPCVRSEFRHPLALKTYVIFDTIHEECWNADWKPLTSGGSSLSDDKFNECKDGARWTCDMSIHTYSISWSLYKPFICTWQGFVSKALAAFPSPNGHAPTQPPEKVMILQKNNQVTVFFQS